MIGFLRFWSWWMVSLMVAMAGDDGGRIVEVVKVVVVAKVF